MLLSTHAIAGATMAFALRRHPLLAFAVALAGHFALDTIPHWHYLLRSLGRKPDHTLYKPLAWNAAFLRDVGATGFDFALGALPVLLAGWLRFPDDFFILGLGVCGGVLPDFLQLVYYVFPNSPIKYLQRFHLFIHSRRRLSRSVFIGVASQVLISLFFLLILINL